MNSRLLNSFNLLAVILLIIGIAGAFSGGKMVYDPGREQNGHEWIIYVLAGALMLVNGFLPAANPPDPKPVNGGAKGEAPVAAADTVISE